MNDFLAMVMILVLVGISMALSRIATWLIEESMDEFRDVLKEDEDEKDS
jgi:pilus assembly protein TadC